MRIVKYVEALKKNPDLNNQVIVKNKHTQVDLKMGITASAVEETE